MRGDSERADRGRKEGANQHGPGGESLGQQSRGNGHDGVGDEQPEGQITQLRFCQMERSLDVRAHGIHDICDKGNRDEDDHDQQNDEVVVFHGSISR